MAKISVTMAVGSILAPFGTVQCRATIGTNALLGGTVGYFRGSLPLLNLRGSRQTTQSPGAAKLPCAPLWQVAAVSAPSKVAEKPAHGEWQSTTAVPRPIGEP